MAEPIELNVKKIEEQLEISVKSVEETVVKNEIEVKPEPHECVACGNRGPDTLDIYSTTIVSSNVSIYDFLYKFTRVDLANADNCSKHMCRTCFDLINVLQEAELEYMKLKNAFEEIISKNPLFESSLQQPAEMPAIKSEMFENLYDGVCDNFNDDSEDEPLAVTKKKRHRKLDKREKKPTAPLNKRKARSKDVNKDSWGRGAAGAGGAAERDQEHTIVFEDIKKENSADGSQSPHYNNGFDANDGIFKDDDDDSDYFPEETGSGVKCKREVLSTRNKVIKSTRKKRAAKAVYNCEECNSKFTSLNRLERHKVKHSDSKPPYICEVCGAHYKHKRACDIHVALHKGISDWKCEECNKLFPSKGALQRHNNIHTGKSNYQCDLCGKSFIHTSSFKMHKLTHSGVKPHACDVCGLALMTRSHLKRHKRVHSGEKRHECTVCGKQFAERYNLVAHSKSHEPHERAAPPAAAPPRRRLFRCPYCMERFERKYMLERHTSSAHGRTLERAPPTPRNTMSKLLKAQAQRRDPASTATPATPAAARADDDSKDSTSPTKPASGSSHKPVGQLTFMSSAGAWSGAYAADFALRQDYSH